MFTGEWIKFEMKIGLSCFVHMALAYYNSYSVVDLVEKDICPQKIWF